MCKNEKEGKEDLTTNETPENSKKWLGSSSLYLTLTLFHHYIQDQRFPCKTSSQSWEYKFLASCELLLSYIKARKNTLI